MHVGVAAQQQRAGAHRAAELVPGHRQRVGAAGGEVDRHLADRLHRVGVERDADLVRDRGQRRESADGADLVVGPHHAGDGDVGAVAERLGQRGRGRPGRSARPAAR